MVLLSYFFKNMASFEVLIDYLNCSSSRRGIYHWIGKRHSINSFSRKNDSFRNRFTFSESHRRRRSTLRDIGSTYAVSPHRLLSTRAALQANRYGLDPFIRT